MSYCVNCGVELHETCSACPLCNTKVYNPNQPVDRISPPPFPTVKGSADPVRRSDVTILTTVVLASTAVASGLLNLFLFQSSSWSLYVIGICIVLWIFCLPLFFVGKLHPIVHILLDGLSIAMYLGAIAFLHPGRHWYLSLALPIIGLSTLGVLIFAVCLKLTRRSILPMAAVLCCEAAVMSVCIELFIRRYLGTPVGISWSAVVLTCCAIIVIALVTIIRRSRLREEVRRRMHI